MIGVRSNAVRAFQSIKGDGKTQCKEMAILMDKADAIELTAFIWHQIQRCTTIHKRATIRQRWNLRGWQKISRRAIVQRTISRRAIEKRVRCLAVRAKRIRRIVTTARRRIARRQAAFGTEDWQWRCVSWRDLARQGSWRRRVDLGRQF